jgi:hypothetical protein
MHCKKIFRDFPVPSRDVTNQTLLGIIKFFPARESSVSDMPVGGGNIANLFYSVYTNIVFVNFIIYEIVRTVRAVSGQLPVLFSPIFVQGMKLFFDIDLLIQISASRYLLFFWLSISQYLSVLG